MSTQKRQRKPNRKFMGSPDRPVNREVRKKRPSSRAGSMVAKKQRKEANQGMLEDAKIVVGMDFGTTFSGFSYASKDDPEKIYTFYQWPGQSEAGVSVYCKTQTSLWYLTGKNRTFELQNWGWPALVSHMKALQEAARNSALQNGSSIGKQSAAVLTGGHFLTKFKLKLGHVGSESGLQSSGEQLPEGLSVEKVISDYLRQLSNFVMTELRNRFGSIIEKKDIKWCLTLPAIWTETAKQTMIDCAEMAGLVCGRLCPPGEDASSHRVGIVLEPEAAALYCQQKLFKHIHFRKGSKFLVVDAGGGTVDLVVHEKPNDSGLKMKEFTTGTGDFCGATYVDEAFMTYLRKKIDCFRQVLVQYPTTVLDLKNEWEKFKCTFEGDQDQYYLRLPPKLATAWTNQEKRRGSWTANFQYDEFVISGKDMNAIFDGEVNKILKLIKHQLDQVPAQMEAIMVVGGFAQSKYLMKRIRDQFSPRVNHIISPPDPGSAICQGAVAYGVLGKDVILSRKSRKTYGVDMIREFREGDPPGSVFYGENGEKLCKDTFCVYTKIGDDVPVDHHVTYNFVPFQKGETEIKFTMYSTIDPNPAFVTDPGVVKVGSWSYKLPPTAWKMEGEMPLVEVTMYFGRTHIEVSGQDPERLGKGKTSMFSVVFDRELFSPCAE